MMPGGTNTMIQILRMSLADLTIKLGKIGFKLPRSAFLQLDNYPSENKNSTIFAYATMLVDLGYMDTVQMNYLVVGHTQKRWFVTSQLLEYIEQANDRSK